MLDLLLGVLKSVAGSATKNPSATMGAINYGKTKVGGGHDHRYNTGPDRTPAQKAGDAAKKK